MLSQIEFFLPISPYKLTHVYYYAELTRNSAVAEGPRVDRSVSVHLVMSINAAQLCEKSRRPMQRLEIGE